jgi:hypothetical protein
MGKIVDLSPTKIRKLAKAAEDGACLFPPGLKRNQMLALAFHMRQLAALVEMLRGRVTNSDPQNCLGRGNSSRLVADYNEPNGD